MGLKDNAVLKWLLEPDEHVNRLVLIGTIVLLIFVALSWADSKSAVGKMCEITCNSTGYTGYYSSGNDCSCIGKEFGGFDLTSFNVSEASQLEIGNYT